jgi:hypothetical protein
MERKPTILHGTWLPEHHCFWLWGEVAAPPRRKGSRRKIPSHPFQAPPETLRERLHGTPHETPLLPDPDAYESHQQTLWLPTIDKLPLPSPDMLATGAISPPEGEPALAPWSMTGLLLPPDAAIDLLLALVESRDIGADVRARRRAVPRIARCRRCWMRWGGEYAPDGKEKGL